MDYANIASASATVVIAVLTLFLFLENRAMRKSGLSPQVVAYLKPHSDGHGGIEFILANVGNGPAFNVRFKFLYDEEDFKKHDAMIFNDNERKAISVLPQDEKQHALLGISFELYGELNGQSIGPLKPFEVEINYKDLLGRNLTHRHLLDIRQFAGLPGFSSKSNAYKISRSLEAIERHLLSISRQASRFNAFVDVTKIENQTKNNKKGDHNNE